MPLAAFATVACIVLQSLDIPGVAEPFSAVQAASKGAAFEMQQRGNHSQASFSKLPAAAASSHCGFLVHSQVIRSKLSD